MALNKYVYYYYYGLRQHYVFWLSVHMCICNRAEAFSDQLAVDVQFLACLLIVP